MKSHSIRPYAVFAGDTMVDGACLVFARTAREARQKGWIYVEGWYSGTSYIDTRARLLRDHREYIMSLRGTADKNDVVECPPVCQRCETWGAPITPDGASCANCENDDFDD